jgi:hypothetical protein
MLVASKRQRNRALKARKKFVNPDDLAPKIAAGLTQDVSLNEALQEHPVQGISGEDLIQQHLGGEQQKMDRLPVWRAVLVDDTESVWTDATGRLQRNVIEKVDVETFNALQSGHMCLRCHEPHPEAFPDVCDFPGCGYPMRERQIMDIAMEFRGHDFIGPAQPISQYLEEQEERVERAEHARRKKEGGSPMVSLSRRILSPGAKKLRGLRGDVHVADAALKAIADSEKKAKSNA